MLIATASALHQRSVVAFQAAAPLLPAASRRPGFVPASSLGRISSPHNGHRPASSLESTSSADGAALPPNLPTMEQLSSDPFMKQMSHAAEIIPFLGGGDGGNDAARDRSLSELLVAQLSHSDGIRGFFVSYLTGDGTTAADADDVPAQLREAMAGVDSKELVPLACMNLIMPTGMVTMHEDPELSASSARTAERGARVLGALLETDSRAAVRENCAAVFAVASGKAGIDAGGAKNDKVVYWSEFCDKWGYGPEQLKDIAGAVSDFC